MRVHQVSWFLAPVTHEPVELLQRLVVVAAVALVGDGDVFARMEMMEGDRAGIAVGDGVWVPSAPKTTASAARPHRATPVLLANPGKRRFNPNGTLNLTNSGAHTRKRQRRLRCGAAITATHIANVLLIRD